MVKLLKDLPVGSLVKDEESKYYGKPIVWKVLEHNHPGYPSNSTTLLAENIISLKPSDAKEPKNPKNDRKSGGNNRYIHSNIRVWLNSSETNWYRGEHSYDAPPNSSGVYHNPYDTEKGFMANLTTDLREDIMPTSLKVLRNDEDGGGLENLTDKVFLLSCTEVGLDNETSYREGAQFNYFKSRSDRVAYPTKEAIDNNTYTDDGLSTSKGWGWQLRTPHPHSSNSETTRKVHPDGSISISNGCYGSNGVRPAFNISSSTELFDQPDSDGVYIIKRNQPPTRPDKIILPDTIMSEQEINIKWSKSTDPDGDRVGYNLERRINSEGWIQIYQGNELSYSDYLNRNTDTVQYRVRAYDDKGNISDWRDSNKVDVIHNTPPIINISDKDLGVVDKVSFTYKVDDADNDAVLVTERLNGKIIKQEYVVLGGINKVNIEGNDWLVIPPGKHTYLIDGDDGNGGDFIVRVTFTKEVKDSTVTLTEPLVSQDRLSKAIVSVNKLITPEVDFKIEVTNNAYDKEPVWKDVTQNIEQGRKIFFENQVATAVKFGFNFRVTMKRKSEGEPAYIRSIAGNFE